MLQIGTYNNLDYTNFAEKTFLKQPFDKTIFSSVELIITKNFSLNIYERQLGWFRECLFRTIGTENGHNIRKSCISDIKVGQLISKNRFKSSS